MKFLHHFKVQPGSNVKLGDIDCSFKGKHEDHKDATAEIERDQKTLRALQDRLYADNHTSLLICLQAMDTGGKDGTINHVLSAMNLQGCRVVPFKQPTPEELAHDFLWRVHRAVPRQGGGRDFQPFPLRRRSWRCRSSRLSCRRPVWSQRYDQINAFEQGLCEKGTHVLKFYLHISEEEQLTRFAERLEDPAKQWKISEADYGERKRWTSYTAAYETALSRCSTENAPWFVIPSNHKWFRNLAVARIVVEYLESLDLRYPRPTVDLDHIRREYHSARKAS